LYALAPVLMVVLLAFASVLIFGTMVIARAEPGNTWLLYAYTPSLGSVLLGIVANLPFLQAMKEIALSVTVPLLLTPSPPYLVICSPASTWHGWS
jgi:hypothetical protein